jgi:hypothetical protein
MHLVINRKNIKNPTDMRLTESKKKETESDDKFKKFINYKIKEKNIVKMFNYIKKQNGN